MTMMQPDMKVRVESRLLRGFLNLRETEGEKDAPRANEQNRQYPGPTR